MTAHFRDVSGGPSGARETVLDLAVPPAAHSAIFPLPGGREVTASAWLPPAPGPSNVADAAALPESTADRRRWCARRRSAHGPGPHGPGEAWDVPLSPAPASADDASGAGGQAPDGLPYRTAELDLA